MKLWTALITPLLDDAQVDYNSLRVLVKEQEEAENGLLILGSTGEALNIDLETRKRILEFVISLTPKVPIMVGVGGSQLKETLGWINYLNTLTIHSTLLVTPLYAKPGDEGQYQWFKALMDKSRKPCVLYNVPSRTGISLSLKAVERLNNHKNFMGIKEASGDLVCFKRYFIAAQGRPVFCGDDALMKSFAREGSAGLISVAANYWPKQTQLYVESCLSHKLSEEASDLWESASNSLFQASNPTPVKRALFEANRISTPTMMLPLTSAEFLSATSISSFNEKIDQWYGENK